MKNIALRWCFVAAALLAAALPQANGQESDEQRFRKLLEQPLVLSGEAECPIERFQFEVHSRFIRPDTTVTVRTIGEREVERVAILAISPQGFPSSFVVEDSFFVVDGKRLCTYAGGRFQFRAGINDDAPGLNLKGARISTPESQITLDLAEFLEFFMIDGAEYKWDSLNQRYSLTTPKGTHLTAYVDRYGPEQSFPLRTVAVQAHKPDGSGMEMTFTILQLNDPPPRTLFQMAGGEPELPIEPVNFDTIRQSHFGNLGITFDDTDPAARALGLVVLRKFKTQEALIVAEADLAQLKAWLDEPSGGTDEELKEPLRRLHELCEAHIVKPLRRIVNVERLGSRSYRLHLDCVGYDRFLAAAHSEIALGPEIVPQLRSRLAEVAVDKELSPIARSVALDLLGQFGLPPLAPHLAEIEQALAADESSAAQADLPAILASLRVRQRCATADDIALLHQTLQKKDPGPLPFIAAAEALAIVGELEPHASLVFAVIAGGVTTDRLLRTVAADQTGQRLLLDELESAEPRLPRTRMFTFLGRAIPPGANHRERLVALSRTAALDESRPADERVAANQVVKFDAAAMASDYPDRFCESALRQDDKSMWYDAMECLFRIGRGQIWYETIEARLTEADPAERVDLADVVLMSSQFQWALQRELPPSLWRVVEMLLADPHLDARRKAPVILLFLYKEKVDLPQSLNAPLVAAALVEEDPAHLPKYCSALLAASKARYRPPCPPEVNSGRAVSEWISNNAPAVREHLRQWRDEWAKVQIR